jgi:hypothetical protein
MTKRRSKGENVERKGRRKTEGKMHNKEEKNKAEKCPLGGLNNEKIGSTNIISGYWGRK